MNELKRKETDMKAKYFKKIRADMKYYDVWVTYELFGIYDLGETVCTLLARTPIEAACRAKRKGYGREHREPDEITTARWARFAVRESRYKSERFIVYIR